MRLEVELLLAELLLDLYTELPSDCSLSALDGLDSSSLHLQWNGHLLCKELQRFCSAISFIFYMKISLHSTPWNVIWQYKWSKLCANITRITGEWFLVSSHVRKSLLSYHCSSQNSKCLFLKKILTLLAIPSPYSNI